MKAFHPSPRPVLKVAPTSQRLKLTFEAGPLNRLVVGLATIKYRPNSDKRFVCTPRVMQAVYSDPNIQIGHYRVSTTLFQTLRVRTVVEGGASPGRPEKLSTRTFALLPTKSCELKKSKFFVLSFTVTTTGSLKRSTS